MPFAPRWRGAELARLLDEDHSRIVGAVVEALLNHGWQARPELTFSRWGERGSIDVFGWKPEPAAVLVVECKPRVVDLQDLLSTMDRKRRLAPELADLELGWRPKVIGSVLALPDTSGARAGVARHAAVFNSMLPARTVALRTWLGDPSCVLAGIWFLHISDLGRGKRKGVGPLRVRHAANA